VLTAGAWLSGSWAWFRDAGRKEQTASIGYEVNTLDPAGPWLRLTYTLTASKVDVDYRIALQTTRLRFGGARWWFTCPLVADDVPCDRRVGKLYLPPGGRYFGCRHCHRLTYTSCQESRKYDGVARLLAEDLGQDFAAVKRMMKRIGKPKR
jgi:hypothetical protein